MTSYLVQTLGCKLNQLESEAIIDVFAQAGFEYIPDSNNLKTKNGVVELPSVIVINTCTVTSKADQKARRVIRKALRDYPNSIVIVTGCYARLNKDDLLKLDTREEQRLYVIDKEKILELINNINVDKESISKTNPLHSKLNINHSTFHIPHSTLITPHSTLDTKQTTNNSFEFNPKRFSKHTRSFLKIQDGCDNHCTYCRIRLARGPSISLESGEVLSRLRILEQSYNEAVLTGVNICQYNNEQLTMNNEQISGNNLTGLLDYLIYNTKKIALRLSSLAPDSIDSHFTGVLSNRRIRPHFHLSVQSCSQKILERMGRIYNSQTIEEAVALLRKAKVDPFLACDIITGFPGETNAEFEETYNMCKKLDFAWIHVFPYSPRQGTAAFSFKDNITESEVTKRVQLFTDLAWHGRKQYVQRWLGKEVDILIENNKKGYCHGTSENYLKALIQCGKETPPPGTALRCKLTEEGNFKDFDVIGKI